jgi:hypothetical protein
MEAVRTRRSSKPQAIAIPAQPAGELTPLEYMLRVINDPSAAQTRRDRLAVAAAPYVHPRPMPVRISKKAQAAKAAKEVGGVGTAWGADLGGEWPPQ